MRATQLLTPTLRENPAEAEIISHQLLVRAGFIRKVAAGIYTYLPLAWRVIKKIKQIVCEEMDRVGGQEILMPIIQPAEIWYESGRWDIYGQELFRLQDRHKRDFCLGPTHEEIITDLIRNEVNSYRQLPLYLYQIQNKYRDEKRPRFGLMRGREFIMKDLYSFDRDDTGLEISYHKMYQAYLNIFKRCGLHVFSVEAEAGAIGGKDTREFMVLAEAGEATVVFCTNQSCGYASNIERAASPTQCPNCLSPLKEAKGIEVGQIFKLGEKYSQILGANYLDENGCQKPMVMGCYGIGITRTMAAVVEQNHDENGIIWPVLIAPYHVVIVPVNHKDRQQVSMAEKIYNLLRDNNIEVVLDDRSERAGVKFKDADLIGYPWQIVVGNKTIASGKIELRDRATRETELFSPEETVVKLKDLIG